MLKAELRRKITKSIDNSKMSRVYFKSPTRNPVFGKFVKAGDHETLFNKDFVRFVYESWMEAFEETGNIVLTKIFAIDTIQDIKTYDNA